MMSMSLGVIHDGERAWALELTPEAAELLRAFVQAHAKLATAMESLAETEIALAAEQLKESTPPE